MTTLRKKQQGAVLAISLIILLVMTLLGVGAMQGTTLEEKMAGNLRDRSLAFQASEAALRDAESFIEGLVNVSNFNGTGGLYGANDSEPDYLNSGSWGNSRSYSGTLDGVASQPQYIVKHVGTIAGAGGALNIAPGYSDQPGGGDVTTFRITARGVGGSGVAQVVLQTHYGKRF